MKARTSNDWEEMLSEFNTRSMRQFVNRTPPYVLGEMSAGILMILKEEQGVKDIKDVRVSPNIMRLLEIVAEKLCRLN